MGSALVSLGKIYCTGCNAGDVGDLRVWDFSYDANQIIPYHEHEKAYICFLISGDLVETTAREEMTYSQARLVFIPKGQAHAAIIGPEGAAAVGFEIADDYFHDESDRDRLPERATAIADRRLFAMLHGLGFAAKSGVESPLAASWPHEIIAALPGGEPDRCAKWLARACDYIHDHASENPSPEQLASIVGRHPTHLMRAFRRHTGLTLGDYVRAVKIDKACQLIRENRLSLTQIAANCGFADQSHFSRCFRQSLGVTPSLFRENIN